MSFIQRLKYFPESFYSVTMGLAGLCIATERMITIFNLSRYIPFCCLLLVFAVFFAITACLMIKVFFHYDEVVKNFRHPIKISFFPTGSISLLLISIASNSFFPLISYSFCLVGTGLHIILTLMVMKQWISGTHYKIEHLNPAWFIPVVGNLLIPIAGTPFLHKELLWFFFSVGMIFWIILMTIVMYRLFYHEPLTPKLMPTLFILIAPPAVGFISYVKLINHLDSGAKILYYFALFIALLIFSNLTLFIHKAFYLSQWAFSFPLAALSISHALMFHQSGYVFFKYLHLFFWGITSIIIMVLVVKTIKAIYWHEICQED